MLLGEEIWDPQVVIWEAWGMGGEDHLLLWVVVTVMVKERTMVAWEVVMVVIMVGVRWEVEWGVEWGEWVGVQYPTT